MSERSEPVSIAVEDVVVAYDGPPVLEGVSIEVEAGELAALLGPSGCGKTSLLRAVAGLEPLSGGSIRLGDRLVSGPGVHVAPERRRVGMVFQDWALFPHLSVADNVAYGLKGWESKGARVSEVLEMVGLSGLGGRAPHTLSGGEQQRVALARALAPEPSVLLLDEPFSNLDAALRAEIRTEVHRLLQDLDVTAVFVTHDQDEAFVLGDRVAVLHRGRMQQWGPPAELYDRPVTPWVARFVGDANLVPASLSAGVASTPLGNVALASVGSNPVGAEGMVLIRPEDVRLSPVRAADEVQGIVSLVEYYGRDTRYEVAMADGLRLRCRLSSARAFATGAEVAVRVADKEYVAYPRSTE